MYSIRVPLKKRATGTGIRNVIQILIVPTKEKFKGFFFLKFKPELLYRKRYIVYECRDIAIDLQITNQNCPLLPAVSVKKTLLNVGKGHFVFNVSLLYIVRYKYYFKIISDLFLVFCSSVFCQNKSVIFFFYNWCSNVVYYQFMKVTRSSKRFIAGQINAQEQIGLTITNDNCLFSA
jgi:hypothetical protein